MDNSVRAAGDAGPGQAAGARRLAISIVLDGRLDAGQAAEVARLVGRLGLDGVWCRQPPLTGTGTGPGDVAAFLRGIGGGPPGVSAGLIVDTDQAGPGPAAMDVADADAADWDMADWDMADWSSADGDIRFALVGSTGRLVRWLAAIADGPAPLAAQIALPPSAAGLATAGQVAVFVPLGSGRDLARAVAEAAEVAAGRPVLVEVPISVGRTAAEAHARADSEELFALVGHPARSGLFGTLEECQAGAARLAHAGATELVCYLPHSGDLIDVLAQLRAIAVGASVLRPGEPPSSPPPPPDGWGGRRPSG
jgi:hypothetical protein